MPKQHEHDVSDSIARAREALGDGMFGGGPIEHFRKGWAMFIWGRTGKVHYFKRRDLMFVRSLCGIVHRAEWEDPRGDMHSSLHGGGDFPRCKRCESKSK